MRYRINSLTTPRLKLTVLDATDSADLFTIRGDPEAMEFWDYPHDLDVGATQDVILRLLRDVAATNAMYWTARLHTDNRFVGLFDLTELQAQEPDIGFMIAKSMWGQGLASEACTAIIREASSLGLVRLRARIHAGNTRSERLLRRLGFVVDRPSAPFEIRPGVTRDCVGLLLTLSG
jgi:ribosomal-protein-alanine N-acetyltransferase